MRGVQRGQATSPAASDWVRSHKLRGASGETAWEGSDRESNSPPGNGAWRGGAGTKHPPPPRLPNSLQLNKTIGACVLSCFSRVWLFATLWAAAQQAPLPSDSPGKNAEVGSCVLLQGIFPTQGSNPYLFCLLHWQTGSLLLMPPGKPPNYKYWQPKLFTLRPSSCRECHLNKTMTSLFYIHTLETKMPNSFDILPHPLKIMWGALSRPPSDVYVRSLLCPFFTLMKLCDTNTHTKNNVNKLYFNSWKTCYSFSLSIFQSHVCYDWKFYW